MANEEILRDLKDHVRDYGADKKDGQGRSLLDLHWETVETYPNEKLDAENTDLKLKKEEMVIAYEEVVIDSDHQFNLLEAAKKEAEVAKQEASFLSDKFDRRQTWCCLINCSQRKRIARENFHHFE